MKQQAFSMFCKCEVVYDGRASSILEVGNYLILCKPDACFSIHGACFAKPLNYQNPGSKIEFLRSGQDFDDLWSNLFESKPKFIVRATNKRESLIVAVYKVFKHDVFTDWTSAKIKLVRSERDLVTQIFNNVYDYFPGIDPILIETEVPTPYGNIDLMIVDSQGIRHIVEVKRRIMSVAGCGQLARYAQHFIARNVPIRQYVMAPGISKNALAYVQNNGQKWVQATFKEQS